MENKIYKDLSIDEYHENKTHVSASGLKTFIKSEYEFFNPEKKERKSHFDVGNVFEDMLTLPREKWNHEVFDPSQKPDKDSDGFRTKANKEWKANWYAEREGKYIATKEEIEMIKIMVKNAKANPMIERLINPKKSIMQSSMFFDCPVTGVPLKTRPDLVQTGQDGDLIYIDIKTTADGSPDAFQRDLAKFDYPIQAKMAIDGIEAATGKKVSRMAYIVVEKKYPYNATVYPMSVSDVNQISEFYYKKLNRLKNLKKEDVLPTYANSLNGENNLVPVTIPNWYFTKFDQYSNNQ